MSKTLVAVMLTSHCKISDLTLEMSFFQIFTSQELFFFKNYMTDMIFDHFICNAFFRCIYQIGRFIGMAELAAITQFTSMKLYTINSINAKVAII